jgi:thioredoxin reductase (NADPH)
LALPTLERLVGKEVFYGAVSEARAMRGEEVFVVGAGNSAGQAALHPAEYAARVMILARGDSLADSMSAYLIEELGVTPNVEIRMCTTVEVGRGQHRLEGLGLKDRATG